MLLGEVPDSFALSTLVPHLLGQLVEPGIDIDIEDFEKDPVQSWIDLLLDVVSGVQ